MVRYFSKKSSRYYDVSRHDSNKMHIKHPHSKQISISNVWNVWFRFDRENSLFEAKNHMLENYVTENWSYIVKQSWIKLYPKKKHFIRQFQSSQPSVWWIITRWFFSCLYYAIGWNIIIEKASSVKYQKKSWMDNHMGITIFWWFTRNICLKRKTVSIAKDSYHKKLWFKLQRTSKIYLQLKYYRSSSIYCGPPVACMQFG